MIHALRRLNDALPELILGILIYGAAALVIGCVFTGDRIYYATGLATGVTLAIFIAVHIARVIEESVRRGEGATRILAAKSVFRYIIVVAVLFMMMWLHIGSLVGAFVGILGLKISAYAQPVLHRTLFGKDTEATGEVRE